MKDKLFIFDMDGTLFDTKNVNYKAYSEALEICGFKEKMDYQYYCDFCNGNNYKTFLPIIVNGITQNEMEKVHQIKKESYSKFLKYARRNNHLFTIIDSIKKDYKVSLVTTASKKNTMDILEAFGDENKFDFIITQEDVKETKPDPECFILAMKKAGVEVDNTLIFEDSETGLKAAKKSGAQYVQVFGFN